MGVNIASADSFSATATTPNAVRISLGRSRRSKCACRCIAKDSGLDPRGSETKLDGIRLGGGWLHERSGVKGSIVPRGRQVTHRPHLLGMAPRDVDLTINWTMAIQATSPLHYIVRRQFPHRRTTHVGQSTAHLVFEDVENFGRTLFTGSCQAV